MVKLCRENKEAIGWTLGDLKVIDPSVCVHHINLNDEAKPVAEPQRRLNPNMQEAVKTEVLKLLDAGIIYPISDSQWVSATHVVPKKIGFTIVANDNGDMIT